MDYADSYSDSVVCHKVWEKCIPQKNHEYCFRTSAGGIPIPRTFKTNIQPGEVVDVLAVMKGNKLKVIDFV